jgi:formylglycine-generating enzyme
MHRRSATHRTLTWFFLLGFAFSLPGPLSFVPDVEAASASASARIIKTLKKQIATLKKQLAAAKAAPTSTPFIEMVTVGNPGNAADAGNTSEPDVHGAVAATFRIGKFEVTNAQYATFLNVVAATDTNGLFSVSMETDVRGGIDQFGTSGSFGYAVRAGMGDKPVNFVSWIGAARFCNWLHNGRPSGLQSAGTTETGSYDLTIPGAIAGNTVTRSPGAKFFLPTQDQWYKAAYHQPTSAGGDTDGYWLYTTKSNDIPTVAAVNAIGEIEPDTANIANYNSGADWDSNGDESNENGNMAAVGSGGTGSAGFYGAFDMGGNMFEWNETVINSSFRGLRGGSWNNNEGSLRSSNRLSLNSDRELDNVGFRVASP